MVKESCSVVRVELMVAWHDGMMIEYGVASTVLRALYAYVTLDSRVTVLTSFYSRETDTQRN